MDPRVSLITLGVTDVERSRRFYEHVLRFPPAESGTRIVLFEMGLGRLWLALYPREALAEDAGLSPAGSGFAGFSLAHNVRSEAEVDAVLGRAAVGGGQVVKSATMAPWGGYSAYINDPDGYLWEVVWNPFYPRL